MSSGYQAVPAVVTGADQDHYHVPTHRMVFVERHRQTLTGRFHHLVIADAGGIRRFFGCHHFFHSENLDRHKSSAVRWVVTKVPYEIKVPYGKGFCVRVDSQRQVYCFFSDPSIALRGCIRNFARL